MTREELLVQLRGLDFDDKVVLLHMLAAWFREETTDGSVEFWTAMERLLPGAQR